MARQFRGTVTGRSGTGGGQQGQASIYKLSLTDGTTLLFDYIEIASDGFRTVNDGEEAWCTRSSTRPDWAEYVVPIRDFSPLELLGIAQPEAREPDLLAELWL